MTGRLHLDGTTILYGAVSGLAGTLYALALALLIAFATHTLQSNPILAPTSAPNFLPIWSLIALYLVIGSFLGSFFAVAYHYWPTRTSIVKALVLVSILGTLVTIVQILIWQPNLTEIELWYVYYLVYAVSLGWIYSRTPIAPD